MIVVVSSIRNDALSAAELAELNGFELNAEILGDHLPAGQHGHVFQHGLAPIAETWRLGGDAPENAAQLIDDERGQCFSLNVLGYEQDGLAALGHLLQKRKKVLHDFRSCDRTGRHTHLQEPPPSSLHQ